MTQQGKEIQIHFDELMDEYLQGFAIEVDK